MKTIVKFTGLGGCLLAASIAVAQRPGDNNPGGGAPPSDLVSRMMAFDKDKDGKLSRAEVTDERLLRLFDRADADKDGSVTRDELTSLATREAANDRQGPPRGGPGGPGGPGMGMPPRPGEILPAMLQQRLGLSSEQKTRIEALQKEVDAKLAQILTEEQKTQLKQIRPRGPGGPGGFGGGPPGGRGRPPGPGGPPRNETVRQLRGLGRRLLKP